MRHRKTPVILLRERAEKLAVKVADLEKQLAAERRFASSLLDKNEARIKAEMTRMQRERNSA